MGIVVLNYWVAKIVIFFQSQKIFAKIYNIFDQSFRNLKCAISHSYEWCSKINTAILDRRQNFVNRVWHAGHFPPLAFGPEQQNSYICIMKRILTIILALTAMTFIAGARSNKIHTFAHRGCWSKNAQGEFIIPENSVAAVKEARRQGYEGIECDVHLTKDGKMVILHDATLNRTARRANDYSKLETPVRLADLTFEELRRDYVLESEDPALRTPIPTLEELLAECRKQGMIPMLHSAVWESYEVAQRMFGDKWICFTGGVEKLQKVREFSGCTILLSINDGSAQENLARLEKIGGHCGISTMKFALYTPEFCKALTGAGYEVQASIFPPEPEKEAIANGISYLLTDRVLPSKRWKKIRTRH